MRTTRVVNKNTEQEMEVEILSQSRFSIRVVAKGSDLPFTLRRDRETQRYGGVLADMILETVDSVPIGRE